MGNHKRKEKGSRSQHEPSPNYCDTTSIVYANRAETEALLEFFPSWGPQDALDILRTIYKLSLSGCGSTTLHILGEAELIFHCSADGTLTLDPASTWTRRTLELARGARLVLGKKFIIPGVTG